MHCLCISCFAETIIGLAHGLMQQKIRYVTTCSNYKADLLNVDFLEFRSARVRKKGSGRIWKCSQTGSQQCNDINWFCY